MQASQRGIFLQLDGVFLLVQRDLLLVIQSFLSGKEVFCPPDIICVSHL